MKKTVLVLAFIGIIGCVPFATLAQSQDSIIVEMSTIITADKAGTEKISEFANEFALLITDSLKKLFPATVNNPLPEIEEIEGGKLRVTYTAVIKRCEEYNAVHYFERVGTIVNGKEPHKAEELARSKSLEKTIDAYAIVMEEFNRPLVFYTKAFVQKKHGDQNFIYICENFIKAGSKKL